MKKYLYILFVVLSVVACSDDDEDDRTAIRILPESEVPEQIARIFRTRGNFDFSKQRHYLIRDAEDLQSFYTGKENLPEIDFEKYNFITGFIHMPYPVAYIKKMKLFCGDTIGLNIYILDPDLGPDFGKIAKIGHIIYWIACPKLPDKMLEVNTMLKIEEFSGSYNPYSQTFNYSEDLYIDRIVYASETLPSY